MQIARGAVGFMLPVRGYADRYTKSRLFVNRCGTGRGNAGMTQPPSGRLGKCRPGRRKTRYGTLRSQ